MLDTDRTTISSTLFQVTNTHLVRSLMAAQHQREARLALRYQTMALKRPIIIIIIYLHSMQK